MSNHKQIIQTLISQIENMSLETLHKFPELERIIPLLHESLQIDDVCDHKFVNGKCICGQVQNKA